MPSSLRALQANWPADACASLPAGASTRQHARGRTRRGPARRIVVGLTAIALGWGALAFGAVYPWAYVPLMIVCGGAGVTALLMRRRAPLAHWPVVAFACVMAAMLVQEIPLPRAALQRVSPAADQLLKQYDLSYAAADAGAAGSARHALSLAPLKTWTAAALAATFGVFLFGLAASLDDRMIRRLVRALLVVGVVVALVALVQRATGTLEIYGFWRPQEAGAHPYGPFVNRNHFAGWILMAWPLGLGYFIGRLMESAEEMRRRPRLIFAYLSSPIAGELMLVAFALVVMALSGLLSMSRSGIICLAIGMSMFGVIAARTLGRGWRRSMVVLYLAVMTIGSVGAIGMGRLESRLDEFGQNGFGDRAAVWADASRVARAYPWTGTGVNSFGTAMLFYQTRRMDVHFDEAHNDYLQLWVEGGVLLTVPVVALLGLTGREIRRRFAAAEPLAARWTRIGATTGLLLMALQETGEFSLQMPGNAALFCVLAAIALHPHKEVGSYFSISER